MSRLEFKDYEKTVKTQQTLAKTLETEKRTLGRTIAKEGRTADKTINEKLDTSLQAVESSAEEALKIRDKIAEGAGLLPSIIEGQFPKAQTTFGIAADIPIILDPSDAPDRTQTKAFFTLEDFDYMIEHREFENADISRGQVVNALKINPDTGVMSGSIEDLQTLMFKFLQTPYGKGLAVAQNMKFQDPTIVKVTSTIRLGDPEE